MNERNFLKTTMRYLPFSLLFILLLLTTASGQIRSIVREQAEQAARRGIWNEQSWDSLNVLLAPDGSRSPGHRAPLRSTTSADSCRVRGIVYGWHPYWQGTAYNDYDFSLLSDVCYFSCEVDPATGSYLSVHNWKTTSLVDRAKEAGCRVHLCVTLFEDHARFLSNTLSRNRLIDTLIALVRLRQADGVNIDFEALPSSQRSPFASFMIDLADRFHSSIPGSQVSIALPAVDWSNVFDVAAMTPHVDLFIIMGYDYHWRGADYAGPVSPRNSGSLWSPYDVTRSINAWLSQGIPSTRLCLGVPYYGYDWGTVDSTVVAMTTGSGSAVPFATATAKAGIHGRRWEEESSTPYYVYRTDTTWRECWYDDEVSLGMKYDLVLMKQLAGIGIWALGYDAGREELWRALTDHLSDCARTPCEGSFTDMGGPAGNYYNDDDFTWTIAPEGARRVRLAFNSFSIADDTLWIHDGRSRAAPLIGIWTSQNSPGIVLAPSGAMTIRFKSNDRNVSWGWTSRWLCEAESSGVQESPVPGEMHLSGRPGRRVSPDNGSRR